MVAGLTTGVNVSPKIDVSALREPAHNPAGFVALERPIRIELVFKHSFAGDDVGTGRTIDWVPCPIGLQSA